MAVATMSRHFGINKERARQYERRWGWASVAVVLAMAVYLLWLALFVGIVIR
jgi:energy-coupling factor transporter transmembrane protein EcfT